jgi:rRNA-processing protein FCF1
MRHGRSKAARKTLQYFGRTIGLKPPYHILLDATFVAALFTQKILPVKPRLDRILQTATPNTEHSTHSNSSSSHHHHHHSPPGESFNKYFITQAALDELREIQEGLQAKKHIKAEAFLEALEWVRKECIVLKQSNNDNDGDDDKEGEQEEEDARKSSSSSSSSSSLSTPAQFELLRRIQENELPYIVASQDEALLHKLRKMGTVPIVRVANNNTVLLLEHPSKQSQSQSKGMERQKWRHSLPEAEKALVNLVRKENRAAAETAKKVENTNTTGSMNRGQQQAPPNRQKMKKAKGPNPLSCKRKQSAGGNGNGIGNNAAGTKESSSKKRRKRAQK